jgi:hypothetical protein
VVRQIHQSHPHIVNMCRILKPAADNLVYHHRLSDDDNLDDIALDLGRHLNKDKLESNSPENSYLRPVSQAMKVQPRKEISAGWPILMNACRILALFPTYHRMRKQRPRRSKPTTVVPIYQRSRLRVMRMREQCIYSRQQTVLTLIRRSPYGLNLLW